MLRSEFSSFLLFVGGIRILVMDDPNCWLKVVV